MHNSCEGVEVQIHSFLTSTRENVITETKYHELGSPTSWYLVSPTSWCLVSVFIHVLLQRPNDRQTLEVHTSSKITNIRKRGSCVWLKASLHISLIFRLS